MMDSEAAEMEVVEQSVIGNGSGSGDEGESRDQETTEPEPEQILRSRKRMRDSQSWQRNIRKRRRNAGQEYTSTTGRAVPPRLTGKDCRCALRCFERVQQEARVKLLSDFNNLKDYDIQNAYLHGLIRRYAPKRRYTPRGTESRRQHSFSYYVRVDGTQHRVCQAAFCSVHGITKKRLERLRRSLGTPPLDKRGRHNNRPNKLSFVAEQMVKTHISSFPRQTSHYCRKDNPNRSYLSADLNISKMHSLYIQKCDEGVGYPRVTECMYRKIFTEKFNLSFGTPRTDTCKVCDGMNLKIQQEENEAQRRKYKAELAAHQSKAQGHYRQLREDQEYSQAQPEDAQVISFDMQQCLPTPHINTGLAFYLRKLWVYNVGIHNCTNNEGWMCMWSENTAKRGSDEVASSLLQYFEAVPVRPKHLIAYSDECGGQNKNFQMVSFWSYLVAHGYFDLIDHKFLVSGHTFLPSDRDFALVEKKKKEKEIYVPSQWYSLVEEARTKARPFHVVRMQRQCFMDFKRYAREHLTRRKKAENGSMVEFRKVYWFRFSNSDPRKVYLKYSLREEESWTVLSLAKRGAQLKPPHQLHLKYSSPIKIDEKKLHDIQRLLPFIPSAHHAFYHTLTSETNETSDTDAEYCDSEPDD